MKIYGYEKNNEHLMELNEVSIQCNKEDIKKLINFLTLTEQKHMCIEWKTDICHSHFKDYDLTLSSEKPDIIIVTKFK